MLNQDRRTRHVRQPPDSAAVVERTPSRTAQQRLTEALRDRADAYRADATVDLTLVDVLVRMDQLEAAAQTLDEHRASLQSMAHDLAVVVAEAAVEREAERVYDTCLRHLHRRARPVAGVRRRLVALTGATAVFVALLLPSTRVVPRTVLASFESRVTQDEVAAARSRLDAARSAAEAVRDARPQVGVVAPTALRDPVVRKQVRAILAADAAQKSGPRPADGVTVLARLRSDDRPPSSHGTNADDEDPLAPVLPLRVNESNPAPDAVKPVTEDEVGETREEPDSAPEGDLSPPTN